jgi:DNA-binding XRE family transcriptional regulator
MTGSELAAARLNAGYSRRGLARHINVPEQTLRRLEQGEGCSPAYAKRVADFFDVQVTDLIRVEDRSAA